MPAVFVTNLRMQVTLQGQLVGTKVTVPPARQKCMHSTVPSHYFASYSGMHAVNQHYILNILFRYNAEYDTTEVTTLACVVLSPARMRSKGTGLSVPKLA